MPVLHKKKLVPNGNLVIGANHNSLVSVKFLLFSWYMTKESSLSVPERSINTYCCLKLLNTTNLRWDFRK